MSRSHLAVAAGVLLAAVGLSSVVYPDASPASRYRLLYSFEGGTDGAYPMSDLTLDSAGNLYGTTQQGGTGTGCDIGCGTVVELERTQDGWKEKVLYSFRGGNDGAFPQAGVIFSSSGKLYGATTFGGGHDQAGTVFELTPDSRGGWTEKVIYIFSNDGSSGNAPEADLTFDSAGNLYGTTRGGGQGRCLDDPGACGAVFELTPQSDGSWTETTLHAFANPPDGGNPSSAVVLDSAGNIYGMTEVGGTGVCRPPSFDGFVLNCGTVYKLTPPKSRGSWAESILYNFGRGGGHAVYPSGSLLFDTAGHLLGTSRGGGNGYGVIFELHQRQNGSWSQTEPHLFYGKDGVEGLPTSVEEVLLGRLVVDEDGDLFAATSEGGAGGSGTVLEIQRLKDGWRPRILHAFSQTGELGFNSGLVLDSRGHLYGTTQRGGKGNGTIYEIVP